MDYERNKLYFFPTPEKKVKPKKIGRIPIIAIIIGFIILISSASAEASGGIITGLVVIAAGIVRIIIIRSSNAKNAKEVAEFNNNRTIVHGSEIDKVAQDYLENLKSKALNKLNIDEDQCKESDPIQFDGYYYNDLGTSEPAYRKDIDDGRYRSSHYSGTMLFFSVDQVLSYELRFSLLKDEKQESTREFFYRDIVDASTKSDTISLGNEKISFEEFNLTTIGGTSMSASIFDSGTVDKSIRQMRNLFRDKKQQK